MLNKVFKYLRVFILQIKYPKALSVPRNIREWEKNIRVDIEPSGKIHVGKNPWMRQNAELWCAQNAEMEIGENVFINSGCIISARKKIVIGDKTIIGPHVMIYDHNHAHHFSDKPFEESEIIIGKNVWIGANACILKGVTIGDNCIIGAGTIVTKDVPSDTMVYCKQTPEYKKIEKRQ